MMEYKTKDFYLSALLFNEGFNLIGSEKHGENTVFFIFENNDEKKLNNLLTEFINKTVMVNLKNFVWSVNSIRNELSKYK
jgi:hypothetical protein